LDGSAVDVLVSVPASSYNEHFTQVINISETLPNLVPSGVREKMKGGRFAF
jgi:hypothetical protein